MVSMNEGHIARCKLTCDDLCVQAAWNEWHDRKDQDGNVLASLSRGCEF